MKTDKPKVCAYVSKEVKDSVSRFRVENGNISESFALNIIITKYLGLKSPVSGLHQEFDAAIMSRIKNLEQRVSSLEKAGGKEND